MASDLEKIIIDEIEQNGPISVARFMEITLSHPEHGYYITRDPFGVKGDFTTSPEISQLFGDIIGVWCVYTWMEMGKPEAIALVECGPGRGTLMADIMRAAKVSPEFQKAVSIHMIETSPTLTTMQEQALEHIDNEKHWHKSLDDMPDMPFILIGNEFLDALPIRQFKKTKDGWSEICVTHTPNKNFEFTDKATDEEGLSHIPEDIRKSAKINALYETSPTAKDITQNIARHCKKKGGYALFIDYGYTESPLKSTLQAVRKHRPSPVLKYAGDQDITAHVDFAMIEQQAAKSGCLATPVTNQGDFLMNLGIEARAHILAKNAANDRQRLSLRAGLSRLTLPEQMGKLFKVMALYPDDRPEPEGFVSRENPK